MRAYPAVASSDAEDEGSTAAATEPENGRNGIFVGGARTGSADEPALSNGTVGRADDREAALALYASSGWQATSGDHAEFMGRRFMPPAS